MTTSWLDSCELQVVTGLEHLEAVVEELAQADAVCFDTETTGLRVIDDQVVALQFCADGQRAFFVPVAMLDTWFQNLPMSEVVRICAPLWDKRLVGHNLGFDWKMMAKYGVDFHIHADTLIMAKLYDVYQPAGLKDCIQQYLQLNEVISFKSLFPPKVKSDQRRFDSVAHDKAVPYACQDVLAGWRLYQFFASRLDTQHFIYQLEHDCIKPLARMELLGVGLDLNQIGTASQEAERIMAEQLALIETLAQRPVSLSKPRDIAQLLYEELKLPVVRTSEKTGAASTDAASLKALQGKHPVVDALIAYREVEKIKAGFLDPLPLFVQQDGCIHTQYNQYGAVSGRLSSREPNLQQVPKERGKSNDVLRKAVRSSILPPPGYVGFLDCDYSQIEYRLFASLTQEPGLMQAFHNNIDVHVQTAAVMTGTPVEQVDKNLRQRGKSINFMAIYGGSKYKLSEMLGCTVDEAEAMLAAYWKNLPNAAAWVTQVKSRAWLTGYCETYFGRRRPLPGIRSKFQKDRSAAEREAVNTSVQGTAADLMKMAIVRTDRLLTERQLKSRLVLTVHDELVIAHHPDDSLDDLMQVVQWAMEITMPGWVETVAEPGYGPNWNDIEDVAFPSRRVAGAPAPAPLVPAASTPVMSAAPPITPQEALTLVLPPTMEPDRLERLAQAILGRPGTTTLLLEVGSQQLQGRQGVQVDRRLLLQLRADRLQYRISPVLEQRLLRERPGLLPTVC